MVLSPQKNPLTFIFPLLLLLFFGSASAQLKRNFYADVCPNIEPIVHGAVAAKLRRTFTTAPGTLRLFFHDCFVRGCDASVLLARPDGRAEKDSSDDLSLAGDGFDTVAKAKEALDNTPGCRNMVSCADILAIAARDVVAMTGGPFYPVELGRRDGRISTRASVKHNVPHPDFTLDELNSMFASHGLTQTDMIALSGAHTIGFSHCRRFRKRIYYFSRGGRGRIDPTLDRPYALRLRRLCPPSVDPRVAIPMDPVTPRIFDNAYFQNLGNGMGLFTSDQVLYTDKRSRATVKLFAANASVFNAAFAVAMVKLGRVGVKTGSHGEIRRNCFSVN